MAIRAQVTACLLLAFEKAAAIKIGASSDDACRCLNFKELYETRKAACGTGLEYVDKLLDTRGTSAYIKVYTLVENGVMPETFEEFVVQEAAVKRREWNFEDDNVVCKNVFSKMNTTRCVRAASSLETGKWYSRNWCYTSIDCKDPNVDKVEVPYYKHVQVKMCAEDEPSLGDLSPVELQRFGVERKMRGVEFLLKHSYPAGDWFYRDVEKHSDDLARVSKRTKAMLFNHAQAVQSTRGSNQDAEGAQEPKRYLVYKGATYVVNVDGVDNSMDMSLITCERGPCEKITETPESDAEDDEDDDEDA